MNITLNAISIVLSAHKKSGVFSLAFKSLSLNSVLVIAFLQAHDFFLYLVFALLFEIAVAYFLLRKLFFKRISLRHLRLAYFLKRYRSFIGIISRRKGLIFLAPLTYLSHNILTVMAFLPGDIITPAIGNLIQRCINTSHVAIQIVSFSYISLLKFSFSPFKSFQLFLVFGGLLLGARWMSPFSITPVFSTVIEVSIASCMVFSASLARLFYESHENLIFAVYFLLIQLLLSVTFAMGVNILFPAYESIALDSFLMASLCALVLTVFTDGKLGKSPARI